MLLERRLPEEVFRLFIFPYSGKSNSGGVDLTGGLGVNLPGIAYVDDYAIVYSSQLWSGVGGTYSFTPVVTKYYGVSGPSTTIIDVWDNDLYYFTYDSVSSSGTQTYYSPYVKVGSTDEDGIVLPAKNYVLLENHKITVALPADVLFYLTFRFYVNDPSAFGATFYGWIVS